MKLSIRVTKRTTDSELIHLGNFFTALGMNRGAHVTSGLTAPLDAAELDEPDVTFAHPTQAHDLRTGELGTINNSLVPPSEAPKRRRRSKAEIEAEALAAENARVAAAEAEAQASNEAGLAEAEAGNADPAPTPDAQQPATPPSETASTTPASASPSEPVGPVTHAEAQKQAIDAARRHGPEKVKAIISEFEGAAKIADLKEADLSAFVAKLQALAVAA